MNNNSPTTPESPDHLDMLLSESEASIPDDGFTARPPAWVLDRLGYGPERG